MSRRSTGKLEQIIQAALVLYRGQTICKTTLRDIAKAAQLPLGNMYYYFKTREEVLLAVLDACETELRTLLDGWAGLEPRVWLGAYFDWLLADPAQATRVGCPFGTLAAELAVLHDPAAPRAAALMQDYREAVTQRTQALKSTDGDTVFAAIQGAYIVARVLNDPQVYQRTVAELRRELLGTDTPDPPAKN